MKYIDEAKHPTTGVVYKVGDKIVIYQGRLGHNNKITIRSMFELNDRVYVSDKAEATQGTYLSAVLRHQRSYDMNEVWSIQFLHSNGNCTEMYSDEGRVKTAYDEYVDSVEAKTPVQIEVEGFTNTADRAQAKVSLDSESLDGVRVFKVF